jgi:hypothetical protein
MWKQLWKKWTLAKPAAFGDLLWEVFVVQFAAFLDRLTLRQVIAFTPVLILVLAYAHSIPIPPELMLLGDVLAYLDIYAVVLLIGMMSRFSTVVFVLKQASAHAGESPAICWPPRRGSISATAARAARKAGRDSRAGRKKTATTLPAFGALPGPSVRLQLQFTDISSGGATLSGSGLT